jgi:hypothetical protein
MSRCRRTSDIPLHFAALDPIISRRGLIPEFLPEDIRKLEEKANSIGMYDFQMEGSPFRIAVVI